MEIMEQGASLCRAFFFSEGESLLKCFPVLALTSHCNLHLTVVELPFLIFEQNTVGVSVKQVTSRVGHIGFLFVIFF